MNDTELMPDDERDQLLIDRVEAFGTSLARKRDEAVAARRECGIEEEWHAAEDAYQGIDEASRGDSKMAKPVSPEGGVVTSARSRSATRSTVVMNITRPYVDAASARVSDMLLPTDDTPWGLSPTPKPQLVMRIKGAGPAPLAALPPGQPMGMTGLPPVMPGMPPEMAGMPPQPPPLDPAQQAQAMADAEEQQAKDACELATTQIEDWLIQCQWHAEVRKMIEDCARLGTGILKGPTPARRKSRRMSQENGTVRLVIEESICPESRCISPWNLYPDGACGENVQDGSGVWERDSLSAKSLRELKKLDGYIDSQIDRALEEGPGAKGEGMGYKSKVSASDRDVFDVWYYHGCADREDLEAAGVDVPEEGDVTAHCVVTMVNNRVIKAAINPLDSGEFPYDVMAWQRKSGLPYGTGVAMQINVPQRMLTGAIRNMNDNAGLSAGPQIVARKGAIVPADGKWEMTPRKVWWANEDADPGAVQQAFMVFNIPTMQQELMNIAQYAMKMAEDVTGLPAMMQGQNTNAPDTVGGMQMMQNNAGTVLRRIARLFDDKVTEPHIRRYYEWLMLYGDDDAAKGDFQIDARGSTALVERDAQSQSIMQMGALATNPAFGIDPEKWFMETLKSQRLDPSRFLMDEDKKAAMEQQPPPQDPALEIAKMRVDADMQKAQLTTQTALQKAQMDNETRVQTSGQEVAASVEKMRIDTDRDNVLVNSRARRDESMHMAKMAELELRRDLAMLDYANREKLSLDRVKSELAREAMKINSVKELAGVKAPADLMPTPPIEPPGRAEPGNSYPA
jgi:hypothetical protein